ncbi:hypothetical protein PCE1_001959 [Barthelona sp. PCE]
MGKLRMLLLVISFNALNQHVPNSIKEKYTALTAHFDSCAALLELDAFDFYELFPADQTMEKCMGEKTMEFVKKIDGIVQEFELSDTLSSTFATRFSDMAEQYLAFKVLYEQEYAGKLEELQKLDVYFDVYQKCRDFAQTEMYSAFKGFMDKFSEFNDIFRLRYC